MVPRAQCDAIQAIAALAKGASRDLWTELPKRANAKRNELLRLARYWRPLTLHVVPDWLVFVAAAIAAEQELNPSTLRVIKPLLLVESLWVVRPWPERQVRWNVQQKYGHPCPLLSS